MTMRLQRFIASAGICSRRKAEEYIRNGRVTVDGKIVTEQGVTVNERESVVTVDGERILLNNENVYVILNKPVGYITSSNGQFGRKTVFDLLVGVDARVFPVGRLDYSTSGLLLLTNDGDFTYKITHPKHKIEKTYIAKVRGVPDERALNALRNGVLLDNLMTAPASCELLSEDGGAAVIRLTVTEGRNRLVRRMAEAVGHAVLELERISIGGITLDGLKCGEYRFLSEDDIKKRSGLNDWQNN